MTLQRRFDVIMTLSLRRGSAESEASLKNMPTAKPLLDILHCPMPSPGLPFPPRSPGGPGWPGGPNGPGGPLAP